jgi:hypothetical protein
MEVSRMKTLTFAFDTQLDDAEIWIKEGIVVQVSDNEYYVKRFRDSTPVIITEAYTYEGEKIIIPATVEWFNNSSFVELRR